MARVVHWFQSRTDGTLPNNLGCKNQKRAQGQLLITSRLNFDLQRQQVSLHLHGRWAEPPKLPCQDSGARTTSKSVFLLLRACLYPYRWYIIFLEVFVCLFRNTCLLYWICNNKKKLYWMNSLFAELVMKNTCIVRNETKRGSAKVQGNYRGNRRVCNLCIHGGCVTAPGSKN